MLSFFFSSQSCSPFAVLLKDERLGTELLLKTGIEYQAVYCVCLLQFLAIATRDKQ